MLQFRTKLDDTYNHLNDTEKREYFTNFLTTSIISSDVRVGDAFIGVEYGSGSIYLSKANLDTMIYCTPFWEGENGILVASANDEGDYDVLETIPFELSDSISDDIKAYYKLIYPYIFHLK